MTLNASALHVVISSTASNVNSLSEGLAYEANTGVVIQVEALARGNNMDSLSQETVAG